MMSLARLARSYLRPDISLKASQSQATCLACPCPSHQLHLPKIHWPTTPRMRPMSLVQFGFLRAMSTEAPSLALLVRCLHVVVFYEYRSPYVFGVFSFSFLLLLPLGIAVCGACLRVNFVNSHFAVSRFGNFTPFHPIGLLPLLLFLHNFCSLLFLFPSPFSPVTKQVGGTVATTYERRPIFFVLLVIYGSTPALHVVY